MSLILLGPSAWLPGYRPSIPGWLVEILPPGVASSNSRVVTPREIRFGLVARLRLANVKATALELHPDRSGEDPASKLLRVVQEAGIEKYALYWPARAVRPAVDVEIGWLLRAVQDGKVSGDNVGVFYEWDPEGRGAARERITADGRALFESLERTRRTTYYQSLVAWGGVLIPWSTYEDLLEFLVVFAR